MIVKKLIWIESFSAYLLLDGNGQLSFLVVLAVPLGVYSISCLSDIILQENKLIVREQKFCRIVRKYFWWPVMSGWPSSHSFSQSQHQEQIEDLKKAEWYHLAFIFWSCWMWLKRFASFINHLHLVRYLWGLEKPLFWLIGS